MKVVEDVAERKEKSITFLLSICIEGERRKNVQRKFVRMLLKDCVMLV